LDGHPPLPYFWGQQLNLDADKEGKTMWKWIAAIVLVLVLAIVGGLYYVYTNLGSYVRVAIERYGSEATQTTVHVSSVTLKIEASEGAIKGLTIHNPNGFSSANALSLGVASLVVDPQSVLGSGPIHIKEVVIDAPQVLYEQGMGGSNLDTLKHNVNAYAAKLGGASPPSATPSATGGTKPERKLIIDNLYVRNGKVAVSESALKGISGLGYATALPTIHLSNIGRAKGGATPAEVTQQVVGAITQEAAIVGAEALTQELVKSGALGKNGAAVGGIFKGILGH
jgi:hypothetical protein